MKKVIYILILIFINYLLFSQDLTDDYIRTNYLPRMMKASIFETEILNNITDTDDKNYVLQFYYKGNGKLKYYLRLNKKKDDLLKLYNTIYSYSLTHGILALEKAKYKHEIEQPVFSQKGGMLRPVDHSFYLRTEDEWTGFSTLFFGNRYGITDYFNISIEGGIGLPQIYIASIILHLKVYETPNKFFFMGLRGRIGYKYQDAASFMFFTDKDTGEDLGYMGLGKDYLTIFDKHSFYFAVDLTFALRFGRLKGQCVYYTIYPKVDFDLQGGPVYVLFCPVMIGYEVRFGQKMEWSFAVEGGYTIPIPWGSIPDGEWINFPSLANISINYRFGDKYYWKKNRDKIYEEAMAPQE